MIVVNALMLRLLGRPIFFAVLSLLVYVFLEFWVPRQFGVSPLLQPLALLSSAYAGMAALATLAYALLIACINGYNYWQRMNGSHPACPRCGMMMEVRSGRRGQFWGCMRYPSCRGTEDY